jgi:hypothetical protein
VGRTPSTQSTLVDRAIRAARLEDAVYDEVAHDRGATVQAANVVVLATLASGIGALGALGAFGVFGVFAFSWIFRGMILSLAFWAIHAWFAYVIGTRVFATATTRADLGGTARALGFAQAPRLLLIVAFVPVLGGLIGPVVYVWVIAASVVAIRASFDFSTGRAIATAIVAWIPTAIITSAITILLVLDALQ